jgi:hypothetical protein
MVVHGTHMDSLRFKSVMNGIHISPIAKMKGEVGACRLVARSEQCQAIPSVTCLEVAPIVRLPNQTHTQPLVKGHGTFHIINADRDVAEPINRWHSRERLKITIVEQINSNQRAFRAIPLVQASLSCLQYQNQQFSAAGHSSKSIKKR